MNHIQVGLVADASTVVLTVLDHDLALDSDDAHVLGVALIQMAATAAYERAARAELTTIALTEADGSPPDPSLVGFLIQRFRTRLGGFRASSPHPTRKARSA